MICSLSLLLAHRLVTKLYPQVEGPLQHQLCRFPVLCDSAASARLWLDHCPHVPSYSWITHSCTFCHSIHQENCYSWAVFTWVPNSWLQKKQTSSCWLDTRPPVWTDTHPTWSSSSVLGIPLSHNHTLRRKCVGHWPRERVTRLGFYASCFHQTSCTETSCIKLRNGINPGFKEVTDNEFNFFKI